MARKVLVVDDDRKARESVARMVEATGAVVITARSGYEAIRTVEAERPDTIVVDGLLPEMHGFEVSRYVRTLSPDYHPRIILMTAIYRNSRYQNEARLKYGVDYYLTKPVSTSAMLEALAAAG